jgi:hypothetical protein
MGGLEKLNLGLMGLWMLLGSRSPSSSVGQAGVVEALALHVFDKTAVGVLGVSVGRAGVEYEV